MNLVHMTDSPNESTFVVDPTVQIIQLCIEFVYCTSLFVAICKAQPRRREKKVK